MNNNPVIALVAACLLAASFLSSGAQAAGDAELQAAREELRLRAATERRMRRDFESLLAVGRMSATEVADFEDYLVGLSSLVDKQRKLVSELQGHAGQSTGSPDAAAPLPADFDRGQTDAEKIALLDAQLGSSLSAFDEKLLREQNELAEKSRSASGAENGDKPEHGGGASGKAGEGEGEKAAGEAGNSASESAGGKTGESGQQSKTGERPESGGEATEGNDRVASAGGASDGGRHQGSTPTPPDIPDGKDDDIVARQLREAAENEKDPELRDKLWEEYRKYKNRTR